MSKQISLRLPEALVEQIDRAVAESRAQSRSDLVSSAVERELRRLMAEHDADIYRRTPDSEFDDMVTWAAGNIHLELD